MQEVIYTCDLINQKEIGETSRMIFSGLRYIFEALTDSYVHKAEELAEINNSTRVRYIEHPDQPLKFEFTLTEMEALRNKRAAELDEEEQLRKNASLISDDVKNTFSGFEALLGSQNGSGPYGLNFGDQDEKIDREMREKQKIKDAVMELRKKMEKGLPIDYYAISDPKIILELNNQLYEQMLFENHKQQENLRRAIMEYEGHNNVDLKTPGELHRLIMMNTKIVESLDIGKLELTMPLNGEDPSQEFKEAEIDLYKSFNTKQRLLMSKVIEVVKRSMERPKSNKMVMTVTTSRDIDSLWYSSSSMTGTKESKKELATANAEIEKLTGRLEKAKEELQSFQKMIQSKDKLVMSLTENIEQLKNLKRVKTPSDDVSKDTGKPSVKDDKKLNLLEEALGDLEDKLKKNMSTLDSRTKELDSVKKRSDAMYQALEQVRKLASKQGVLRVGSMSDLQVIMKIENILASLEDKIKQQEEELQNNGLDDSLMMDVGNGKKVYKPVKMKHVAIDAKGQPFAKAGKADDSVQERDSYVSRSVDKMGSETKLPAFEPANLREVDKKPKENIKPNLKVSVVTIAIIHPNNKNKSTISPPTTGVLTQTVSTKEVPPSKGTKDLAKSQKTKDSTKDNAQTKPKDLNSVKQQNNKTISSKVDITKPNIKQNHPLKSTNSKPDTVSNQGASIEKKDETDRRTSPQQDTIKGIESTNRNDFVEITKDHEVDGKNSGQESQEKNNSKLKTQEYMPNERKTPQELQWSQEDSKKILCIPDQSSERAVAQTYELHRSQEDSSKLKTRNINNETKSSFDFSELERLMLDLKKNTDTIVVRCQLSKLKATVLTDGQQSLVGEGFMSQSRSNSVNNLSSRDPLLNQGEKKQGGHTSSSILPTIRESSQKSGRKKVPADERVYVGHPRKFIESVFSQKTANDSSPTTILQNQSMETQTIANQNIPLDLKETVGQRNPTEGNASKHYPKLSNREHFQKNNQEQPTNRGLFAHHRRNISTHVPDKQIGDLAALKRTRSQRRIEYLVTKDNDDRTSRALMSKNQSIASLHPIEEPSQIRPSSQASLDERAQEEHQQYNSSVISNSQQGNYPAEYHVFVPIKEKVPDHLNILVDLRHQDDKFLEDLYQMHRGQSLQFEAVGKQISIPTLKQFKKEVKHFVEKHSSCGPQCMHLSRFYERCGLTLLKAASNKQPYIFPVVDLINRVSKSELELNVALKDTQARRKADLVKNLSKKPVFI